jgi:hypothetical protein
LEVKYFIGNPQFGDRPDIAKVISTQTHEVRSESALEMYRIFVEHDGYDGEALEKVAEQYARGLFKLGQLVTLRHYDLWGEDVTDEELFKRRLNGTLAKSVIL